MNIVVDNVEIRVNLEHYDDWKEAWLGVHGIDSLSTHYTYAVSKQINREYVESVKGMGEKFYKVICEEYDHKFDSYGATLNIRRT